MDQKKKKEYLSRIGMVASIGAFQGALTQKDKKELKRAILVNVLLFVFFLLISLISAASGMDIIEAILDGLFIISIIAGVELAVCLLYLFFYLVIRRRVSRWLEDATEGEGYTQVLDVEERIQGTYWKMKIVFQIDGEKFERETGGVGDPDTMSGYFRGLEKFADVRVKVLYSRKYNEVMILND